MSDGFKFAYLKELHCIPFPRGVRDTLRTILDYADADGENAYPGEQRLATDCCVTVRTIQRHIAWLIEHGWLVEVSRGRKYGGASVYRVAYGTVPGDEREAAETPVEATDTTAYAMTHGNCVEAAGERTDVKPVPSSAGRRTTDLAERGRELIRSGKYAHLVHDEVPF